MTTLTGTLSVREFWPLAMLRIYTGVIFLIHGWGKVNRDNFDQGLAGFIGSQENMFGFYRGFAESLVLSNPGLFAFLVGWGELLLGLALIAGLATRYAAWGGAFLMLNFWFAKGQAFFNATNYDIVWLFIFVVLALLPAGHVAGVDGRLSDRFRFLR